MTQHPDRNYFLQRAEQELQIAQSSLIPAAVRVHYELANRYLDKAHGANAAEPVSAQPQSGGEDGNSWGRSPLPA